MFRKILVSLTLLAAASNSLAAEWIPIHTDTFQGTQLSMDIASKVFGNQHAKVWMRTTLHKPQVNYANSGKKLKHIKMLWLFNCTNKTLASGMSVFVDDKGNNITTDPGDPEKYDAVVPESTGDVVMSLACK
ncbi:MAG: surface-adhesin E family protein [Thiobacillus sp.]